MIEAAVPSLLRDVGVELDDLGLDLGTNSRLSQDRVIRALDIAQRKVWDNLRADGVDPLLFKQAVTLTVDSSDSDRYPLPPRTRQVILLQDDDSQYTPLSTYQTSRRGYVVEEGGRAVRLREVDSVSGNVVMWGIYEPCRLSCGTIGTDASTTTIVLPSDPSVGDVETTNDYYNGARVGIVAGTAGINEVRTFTDYVGSTRIGTVAAWGTAPTVTGSSVYSILLDLPQAAQRAVVLRAALMIGRSDEVMREYRQDLVADYQACYRDCRVVLLNTNLAAIHTPRAVWNPGGVFD